ncbi:MAG: acyl-CoA/acyl-ACP dehydrogenase [Firmicutes bacterium]|jgi:alkylation response protein AidB-like acyl-CoA dehydrogenase|nr:acyl-CoA/acyl-ACP dehydrogenase [Bacillota bacterium]
MDFQFNDEQKMFQQSVRELLEKEFAPIVDERDPKGPLSREEGIDVMKKLKKVGVGLDPESIEDLLDPVMFGIIAEEFGRVWPSLLPLFGMGAIPAIFAPSASEDARKRLVPRLEAAEFIGCFAETEPDAGCDTSNLSTTAKREGDYYIVNGTKSWISNATIADTAFVGVKDADTGDATFLLVEKEISPFEATESPKMGWKASPTGEMFFDNCKVPVENEMSLLMEKAITSGSLNIPDGFMKLLTSMTPITAMLTIPRAGMGLASVGIAQAAFEASVKYARERVQFGKPIGRFQLIQDMLYQMNVLIETARLLGYKAATAIIDGDREARRLSAMAKVYGGQAAFKVTDMAIQIHGGMGISQEMPLERYFRDARLMTIPDGTSEIMKLITGYTILGKGFAAYS